MADSPFNGRIMTITLQRAKPTVYRNFPRSVLGLAIVQTICGAAFLIITFISTYKLILGLTFISIYNLILSFSCSVLMILAGSFGIAAATQKAVFEIISSTILSMLASVLSTGVVLISAMSLPGNTDSTYVGCQAVLLVFAIAEVSASIAMSAIGCQFSCFCCRKCCCKYDMTTTETGIIHEGQDEQLLRRIAQTATPRAFVISSQQQTTYRPSVSAALEVGGVSGNNAWLQNQYTRLDDEILTA